MSITIKDIAAKAKVSITTVSLILNDKASSISEETKERVLKIIKEYEYTPSAIARGLVTTKTKTIGLIIPDVTNQFFAEIAKGVEDILNGYNYSLFLCNSYNNIEKEKEYLKVFKERYVDGIIVSSANTVNEDYYMHLKKLKIPFIILDRHVSDLKHNCVLINDEQGGYLATKHLLELNHKKIACIIDSMNLKNINERLQGYKNALKDHGVELDEDLIAQGNLTVEGGYEAALKLLTEKKVTAIFACNDLMALGVYEAASGLKLKVPEDLSVVGFDDIKFAYYFKPKLTTIKQPIYHIGQAAANNLCTLIKENKFEISNKEFEVSLVKRESTKMKGELSFNE